MTVTCPGASRAYPVTFEVNSESVFGFMPYFRSHFACFR